MCDEKVEIVFRGNRNDDEVSLNTIDIQKKMEEILFKIDLRSKNSSSKTSGNTRRTETELVDDVSTSGNVLCVLYSGGKLGAAYIDPSDDELYIIEDIVEMSPEFNTLKNLYCRLKPSLTMTISKRNTIFSKALIEITQSDSIDSPGTSTIDSLPPNLQLLKEKEYSYEKCVYAVKNLRLPGQPENITNQIRSIYLHSLIDFTKTVAIHALGVLLLFFDKFKGTYKLGTVRYNNLNIGKISDAVMMDQDTFRGLQIFKSNFHFGSQWQNRFNDDIEEPNLFKIFNRCKSKIGENRLKYIMLQPTNDLSVLRQRQEFIEFCLKSNNKYMIDELTGVLKKTRNITMAMRKIQGNTAKVEQWQLIQQTLQNVVYIHGIISPYIEEVSLFKEYVENISDEIATVYQFIHHNIDFETKHMSGKISIKDGVDDDLDTKRRFRNELSERISSAAALEMNNLPEFVTNCCILYIPEIGYILTVDKWAEDANCLDLEKYGLRYLFRFDDKYNYKSPICDELDKNFGDIHLEILSREVHLLAELNSYVGSKSELLRKPLKILSLFDSLLALAEVARDYNYVKPDLNDENVMIIEDGRHPLLETFSENCISNNYQSIESRLKILTGPNGSGKSIYLKQVAIIVYLAHIGSYVPARKAVINLTSGIYSRIQPPSLVTSESVSSFLHSLRQMTRSSICSDRSSLIVIDEFGKGTIEEDGLALLTAFLKSFLIRQEFCPHILVSTHYIQLTHLLPESQMIEHLRPSFQRHGDNILFLYKIEKGVSSSFAAEAALLAGIPHQIVERSKEVLKVYRELRSISCRNTTDS